MADGGPEWELCKENVQPLKKGREMDSLSAALQQSGSDTSRLQSQRQAYEVQLRMYNGDDPMSVWEEYIKWTEQNFPTGGKESHLVKLLERCVVHFNDCEALKNDSRFIDIWIKVANMSSEPGDIFTYMYDHGLGCQVASFYVAWAGMLESLGDTKKADAVFDMGLKSAAEPRDLLNRRHSEFQMRITRMTMTGQLQTPQEEEVRAQKPRKALGVLKVPSKKGVVPSIRNPSSSSVKLSGGPTSGNRAGPAFSVCQDENAAASSLLPPQTGEYASVPVQSQTNRENSQKAGVWTNARASQKTRTPQPSEPGFTVYTEALSSDQAMMTPMKSNPHVDNLVLSERKVKPPTNFLQNIEQAGGDTKTEANQRPMYCKELIYQGGIEISFEELRGAVYEQKKKDQKKEQELMTSVKNKLREELRLEIEAQMAQKFKLLEQEKQALISSLSKVNIQEQSSEDSAQLSAHALPNAVKRPLVDGSIDIPSKIHSSSSAASSFLSDPPSTNINSLSVRSDPPSADHTNSLAKLGSSFADRNTSVSGQYNPPAANASLTGSNASLSGQSHIRKDLSNTFQTPDVQPSNMSSSISRHDPPSGGSVRTNPSLDDHSLNLSKPDRSSIERSISASNHTDTQNRSKSNLFGQKLNLSRSGPLNTSCRTPDPQSSFSSGNTSSRGDLRRQGANPNDISQSTPSTHSGLFSMTGSSGRLPSAEPTPDTSMTTRLGFGGKVSIPATPTVNTKAAMQVVQSMFNRTLNNNLEGEFGWDAKPGADDDDSDDDCMSQFANKTGVGTSSGTGLGGFLIYDENAMKEDKPQATDLPDKENVCVPSEKPSGLPLKARLPLQPKKVVPSVEQEETEEDMDHQMSARAPLQSRLVVPFVDEEFRDDDAPPATGYRGYPVSLSPKTYSMPMLNHDDDDDEVYVGRVGLEEMGDLTFAPNCMSTRIFHPQLMQTESTPFTPTVDLASIPRPPVDNLEKETLAAPKTPKCLGESASAEQTPGTTVNRTAPSFNETETNATTNDRTEKGLSPIIETSNEDTRSTTASSNGSSTLDHHCSLSATHGAYSTTGHIRPMSPIREPSHESLFEKTCHEIDVSSYVPSSPRREDFEKSIMINPLDPFDEEEIAKFLAQLDEPLEYSSNYREIKDPIPPLKTDGMYIIGDIQVKLLNCVGKGAFGQVWKVDLKRDDMFNDDDDDDDDDDKETKVIKVQKPACPWELYITNELHERLAKVEGIPDVRPSIMKIDKGYFFADGSCLLYDYYKHGTLLNIANMYKKNKSRMPEVFILYITCELLAITEAMIECNIIHGDVKPDNFLFRGLPDLKQVPDSEVFSGPTKALMMIDFGRSIDLNFYPSGTTFTNKVNTSCFMCTEMMTERPWTYQTDLFGLAGTVFLLMFLDYMKVYQEKGFWRTTGNLRRQWQYGDLWGKFFNTVLNISSCNDLPDLRSLREEFQRAFLKIKKDYIYKHPELELQLYKM